MQRHASGPNRTGAATASPARRSTADARSHVNLARPQGEHTIRHSGTDSKDHLSRPRSYLNEVCEQPERMVYMASSSDQTRCARFHTADSSALGGPSTASVLPGFRSAGVNSTRACVPTGSAGPRATRVGPLPGRACCAIGPAGSRSRRETRPTLDLVTASLRTYCVAVRRSRDVLEELQHVVRQVCSQLAVSQRLVHRPPAP